MNAGARGFRHEALLYGNAPDFIASAVPFVREGVEAGEPVLVAATPATIDLLRSQFGGYADSVLFTDMTGIGTNPSRIIPAWRQFVSEHGAGGRPLRGIGEPVWKGRTPAELVECERHEALLNEAFADSPPLWLLCPYDGASLDPDTLEEACHTHPLIWQGESHLESCAYDRVGTAAAPMDAPLPDPPDEPPELPFDAGGRAAVRSHVSWEAARAALDAGRTGDLLLAINEVVDNSIRHGGGGGVVRTWREAGTLVCEIRDQGHLSDPMLGRVRPTAGGGGWGLWLVNQLCDLVQLRSFATGSIVRLHMRLDRRLGQFWQTGSDFRIPATTMGSVPEPIEALPIAMHEVRRPLALALGYLSMLGEDLVDPTPRQRKLLKEAEVRLSDLRRQIEQLAFLGRTLSGAGWSKLEVCDLARELEQVMVRAKSEAELAGGRVTVETPQTKVRALADPALLRQLVDNLLNNAIKYSDEPPEVQVEIGSSSRPYVRVVDHGIGMDEQTAATIFTKGFRGESVRGRHGSGLGLFLSRRAAEQMQAHLELESTQPDKGSVFRLELQPDADGPLGAEPAGSR